MCLIVFAYDCHPEYRLILGANRDEYHGRPSEPVGFWKNAPHLLAGRDTQAGGTWMGVTTSGKLAAITNYRDSRQQVAAPPSRGKLVSGYLLDESLTPEDYQKVLCRDGQSYNGFNLLYGSLEQLYYFTNRGGSSGPVSAGIHGLSNHLLDTCWPKVIEAKSRLEVQSLNKTIDPEQLFTILAEPVSFADDLLPDTGVGIDRERLLSPVFITNNVYGTRSSTVVLVQRSGNVSFVERIFDSSAQLLSTQSFTFQLQGTP